MVRDEDFNKAVSCLPGMADQQLAMAGMVCKLGQIKAVKAGLDDPKNKNCAREMCAMFGEVTKEMVRRLCRDSENHKTPEGMDLDAAVDMVDEETEAEMKELEAA